MLTHIPIRDNANELPVGDNRKLAKVAFLHLQPRLDQKIIR
jgi:hypothetical protein